MKYAILVDAGFIKRKLGSQASPLDSARVLSFLDALRKHAALKGAQLHRVYWYDAAPLDTKLKKPLAGGVLDLGSTDIGRANTKLIGDLCKAPYFSFRKGDLVSRGWKIRQGKLPATATSVSITAADLQPNIQQKGVDMRLGLDIAALTLKQHVEAIVLVAGDSDFVPAMKFARREGAQLFLVTFGHTVRPDMLEHSDMVLEVNLPTATQAASKADRKAAAATA